MRSFEEIKKTVPLGQWDVIALVLFVVVVVACFSVASFLAESYMNNAPSGVDLKPEQMTPEVRQTASLVMSVALCLIFVPIFFVIIYTLFNWAFRHQMRHHLGYWRLFGKWKLSRPTWASLMTGYVAGAVIAMFMAFKDYNWMTSILNAANETAEKGFIEHFGPRFFITGRLELSLLLLLVGFWLFCLPRKEI